jgi:hypothetical protein
VLKLTLVNVVVEIERHAGGALFGLFGGIKKASANKERNTVERARHAA